MYRDRRLLDAHETAAVLLHCDTGTGYLASARLAAQLGDEFVQLADPRRAERVSLGLQAAGPAIRIARDRSPAMRLNPDSLQSTAAAAPSVNGAHIGSVSG